MDSDHFYCYYRIQGATGLSLAPNPVLSCLSMVPKPSVLRWVQAQCRVLNNGGHDEMVARPKIPFDDTLTYRMNGMLNCVCNIYDHRGCQKPYQNILGSVREPEFPLPAPQFSFPHHNQQRPYLNPLARGYHPTQILKCHSPLPLLAPLPYQPMQPRDAYSRPETPPMSIRVNFHGPNWKSLESQLPCEPEELGLSPKAKQSPKSSHIKRPSIESHSSNMPNLTRLRLSTQTPPTSLPDDTSALESSRISRTIHIKERRERKLRRRLLFPIDTAVLSIWDLRRKDKRFKVDGIGFPFSW